MNTDLLQFQISEKQFVEQYEKCKKIVDSGINDYFILLNNDSFSGVREIGNTTLRDVEDLFGTAYIPLLRFGDLFNCNGSEREKAQTIRVRRVNKGDQRRFRGSYRFIPNDCFVCEWCDGTGLGMCIPFIQNGEGKITFLCDEPLYRTNRRKGMCLEGTLPKEMLKRTIELLPDYASSLLAIVKYKGVDMIIPVEPKSAKITFKRREKENEVKRHLIHDVKSHNRKTSKNTVAVKRHVRGRSNIKLNGIDIVLCASYELAEVIDGKTIPKRGER